MMQAAYLKPNGPAIMVHNVPHLWFVVALTPLKECRIIWIISCGIICWKEILILNEVKTQLIITIDWVDCNHVHDFKINWVHGVGWMLNQKHDFFPKLPKLNDKKFI